MPEFFALLAAEPEPAVRVVLGHFFFVYIHPYFDGNGRMGRFLMNLMVAAGGWRWTLVTVDTRDAYMAALERASVHQEIEPLTRYLAARLEESARLSRGELCDESPLAARGSRCRRDRGAPARCGR